MASDLLLAVCMLVHEVADMLSHIVFFYAPKVFVGTTIICMYTSKVYMDTFKVIFNSNYEVEKHKPTN